MPFESRIIPCLLLSGEGLVKTRGFSDPVYVGDPVNVVSIFNDFEVDEIVLLSIGAARSRVSAPLSLLKRIAEECFIPLSYGGGLDSIDSMSGVLQVGFEKVIVNTLLHTGPSVVSAASAEFGRQAVVGSIDVRQTPDGPRAFTRGGSEDTGADPVAWARRAETLGVGELLVTSIDREGGMGGFDLDLIQEVTESVRIPVIAHGGAGSRRELSEPIRVAGASAVAAGSIFVFQGKSRGVLINYPSRTQIETLVL